MLLLMVSIFSGCTEFATTFELAGEKAPVTISNTTHSALILDFQLGVGEINLEAIPTAASLVDVVTRVSIREGSDGTLEAAEEVTTTSVDTDTFRVDFDSNDQGIRGDYKYDFWIKVGVNIDLQINFDVATGDIDTDLADSSLTLSSFDLEATTGTITVLLSNLVFSDPSPSIHSSTGSQTLTFTDLRYASGSSWSILTTTGSIDLDLTDSLPYSNFTTSHTLDISCTTGGISVFSALHELIGLSITASVSTGTISLPGTGSTYTSPNFDTASVRYSFTLASTTGDITFS
jgi:hypothetical protein